MLTPQMLGYMWLGLMQPVAHLQFYTLDTEIVNGTTYQGTPGNPVLLRKMLMFIHSRYLRQEQYRLCIPRI